MNVEEVQLTYADLRDRHNKILDGLQKQQLVLSLLRLVVFIAGVGISAVVTGAW